MKEILLTLSFILCIHDLKAQSKTVTFDRNEIISKWKKSAIEETRLLNADIFDHNGYMYTFSAMDSVLKILFKDFTDSCNCSVQHFYIVLSLSSGEVFSRVILLRSYNNEMNGYEMSLINAAGGFNFKFRKFRQDEKLFRKLFLESEIPQKLNYDMLLISIYKEGEFKSKIINLDNHNWDIVSNFLDN